MKLSNSTEQQKKCTDEVIAWLHECWEVTERNGVLQPDPFYERTPKLTNDVIDKVLKEIEDLMKSEFEKYYSYHVNAQGVSMGTKLVPPNFRQLPEQQKMAIVQGIDRICLRYVPGTINPGSPGWQP